MRPSPPNEAASLWGERAAVHLAGRWSVVGPFVLVGSVLVVAGGLVAALSRPLAFELGPWLAAYLVLVGGVAQVLLGLGQACLADSVPRTATIRAELVGWNVGSGAAVAGSVTSSPILTTLGAVVLVHVLRTFHRSIAAGPGPTPRWPGVVYRGLLLLLFLSVLTGVGLAWARHG